MALFLQNAWLIPLLPLLGCALITFTPIRHNGRASGWAATGLMLLSTGLALGLLMGVAGGYHLHDGAVTQVAAEAHSEGESHSAEGEGHGAFAFPEPNVVQRFPWAPTGSTVFEMGIYVDGAVAAMLMMVTIAATCIHLFSIGYMAANARQGRFFSFISLFSAAMLMMIMADNLLLFFMAWEVMGLCSYLLIGFLYERPQASRAAVKAFITTRIGDVLMLLGLVYLYTQAGSLAFGTAPGEIFNPEFLARIGAEGGLFGLSHAGGIALLIFCGTIGKSAQFPLHVWLPDAMEGPTPVSALIHAATMVAAGVFLVARTYPIFTADTSGVALGAVTVIGAFTALFAATIAVAQYDIKRILAYSTLSQLGFMVAAIGIGGWVAGVFHLITHAFFKALLFLGSGAVIHAMEATPAIQKLHHHDEYAAQQTAQDIRNMGGLRTKLPWTFWTYTAGYLALAGVVPFAGFWSKDEILADAFKGGHWITFAALVAAAFLTAFYMTRQWRLVFFGEFRGERPVEFVNEEGLGHEGLDHEKHESGAKHAKGETAKHGGAKHETPHAAEPHAAEPHAATPHAAEPHAHAAHAPYGQTHVSAPDDPHWHEDMPMTAALVVLASFAVTAGLFNLPSFGQPGAHWLADIWGQAALPFSPLVAGVSLVVALAGIGLGWRFYAGAFGRAEERDPLEARAPGLFRVLNEKYRIDELYAASFGRVTDALAVTWAWIDRALISRVVAGVGVFTLFLGRLNFIIDDTLLNDGPDGLAGGTNAAGRGARRIQTGRAQDYVGYVFGGAVVLALLYLYVLGR